MYYITKELTFYCKEDFYFFIFLQSGNKWTERVDLIEEKGWIPATLTWVWSERKKSLGRGTISLIQDWRIIEDAEQRQLGHQWHQLIKSLNHFKFLFISYFWFKTFSTSQLEGTNERLILQSSSTNYFSISCLREIKKAESFLKQKKGFS